MSGMNSGANHNVSVGNMKGASNSMCGRKNNMTSISGELVSNT